MPQRAVGGPLGTDRGGARSHPAGCFERLAEPFRLRPQRLRDLPHTARRRGGAAGAVQVRRRDLRHVRPAAPTRRQVGRPPAGRHARNGQGAHRAPLRRGPLPRLPARCRVHLLRHEPAGVEQAFARGGALLGGLADCRHGHGGHVGLLGFDAFLELSAHHPHVHFRQVLSLAGRRVGTDQASGVVLLVPARLRRASHHGRQLLDRLCGPHHRAALRDVRVARRRHALGHALLLELHGASVGDALDEHHEVHEPHQVPRDAPDRGRAAGEGALRARGPRLLWVWLTERSLDHYADHRPGVLHLVAPDLYLDAHQLRALPADLRVPCCLCRTPEA
mmetsp:Transcript_128356/g.411373  ORF Transcript_128356/g.411373 Transcript_128356/m.411373 type:complete len:334 (+) Transcript_128356:1357-2358(+)